MGEEVVRVRGFWRSALPDELQGVDVGIAAVDPNPDRCPIRDARGQSWVKGIGVKGIGCPVTDKAECRVGIAIACHAARNGMEVERWG
jgi:hypothetical protein